MLTKLKVYSYHVSHRHISPHGHPQDRGAARTQWRNDFNDSYTPRICAAIRQT